MPHFLSVLKKNEVYLNEGPIDFVSNRVLLILLVTEKAKHCILGFVKNNNIVHWKIQAVI